MKTMKLFFMAALVLLMTTSCSKDDDFALQPQKAEVITITAQLAPKTNAATRAVSEDAVNKKIVAEWAVNEHIAVLYEVSSVKKVADAEITAVDGDGVATITFTVDGGTTNDTPCTLVYPLSAAKDDNTGVKDAATLHATQDGTLNANLDVRVGAGTIQTTTPGLTVTTQPAAQFAIFKFTLANNIDYFRVTDGSDAIITQVTPASASNSFYAALPASASGTSYKFVAFDSSNKYTKSVSSTKAIAAGNYYQTSLSSWDATAARNSVTLGDEDYVAQDGDVLTGTMDKNNKLHIAAGATVTLSDMTHMSEKNKNAAGINCLGNVTIILKDGTTNTVMGSKEKSGIYVPSGSTLTIMGTGAITAIGGQYGAGIGSGYDNSSCGNITIMGGNITASGGNNSAGIGSGNDNSSCGNITIMGGNITATGNGVGAGIGCGDDSGSCGNITITGGIITATGDEDSAGIGGSNHSTCGNITITNGVTSVTATKGYDAPNSIGKGKSGSCGTVTIGGTVYWNGSAYQNGGDTYLTTSPLIYPAPSFSVSSTKKVYFAPGNLQYNSNETTYKWRFAANQWDYVGAWDTSTWVDLFGWGTWTGNTPNPLNTSAGSGDYSWNDADFTKESLLADASQRNYDWRTLTGGDGGEWSYLLNINGTSGRSDAYRFARGRIHDTNGLIIFPDGFDPTVAGVAITNANTVIAEYTLYSDDDWRKMAAAGCIFLPMAGNRSGLTGLVTVDNSTDDADGYSYYWSSTPYPGYSAVAHCLGFGYNGAYYLDPAATFYVYNGYSVRLVRDAN